MPYVSIFPVTSQPDPISMIYGKTKQRTEYTDSLEEVGGLTLASMGNMYQVMFGNQLGRTSKFFVSGTPYWVHLYSLETGLGSLFFEKRMPAAKPSGQSMAGGLGNLLSEYNPRTLGYLQH